MHCRHRALRCPARSNRSSANGRGGYRAADGTCSGSVNCCWTVRVSCARSASSASGACVLRLPSVARLAASRTAVRGLESGVGAAQERETGDLHIDHETTVSAVSSSRRRTCSMLRGLLLLVMASLNGRPASPPHSRESELHRLPVSTIIHRPLNSNRQSVAACTAMTYAGAAYCASRPARITSAGRPTVEPCQAVNYSGTQNGSTEGLEQRKSTHSC